MTNEDTIRLLVRADDMGLCASVNDACIMACDRGPVRSLELMAPAPWFHDAAIRLQSRPDIDVGVHLTVTSEWARLRWRPLTKAASLRDADGCFPHDRGGLLARNVDLGQFEAELRAQIELVLKYLPHASHVSCHMYAATAAPGMRDVVRALCEEYRLWPEFAGPTRHTKFPGLAWLDSILAGGVHAVLTHVGTFGPELESLAPAWGGQAIGKERAEALAELLDPAVMETIQRRGIQLVSYRDIRAKGVSA